MNPVKKVEIIADALQIRDIVKECENLALEDYSVLPVLAGHGQDDEGLTGTTHYLVVVCGSAEADTLLKKIRSELGEVGGICLISDAQRVEI